MNLGTLVTIAAAAPPNFTILVLQNGSYEANGGHPIPNREAIDFTGLARAAGIRSCQQISELADFERKVPELLTATGPVYATLDIVQGPLGPRSYREMYREERRKAFKEALRAG